MEINTLEQFRLKKAANDSGWQIKKDSSFEQIILISSFFKTEAIIQKKSDSIFNIAFSNQLNINLLDENCKEIIKNKGDFLLSEQTHPLTILLRRAAELFYSLPDNPFEMYQKKLNEYSATSLEKTESECERCIRLGQDIYRKALLNYWENSCAVTGVELNDVLRASHIKPWAKCTNDQERLNVYNGILLNANLDALFDKGYISFTDEGFIMISSRIESYDRKKLGLNSDMKLRKIEKEHLPFLDYHHNHIWKN